MSVVGGPLKLSSGHGKGKAEGMENAVLMIMPVSEGEHVSSGCGFSGGKKQQQ